jgi:hypothetical protein
VKRVADYCSKYDVRVAVAAKGMAGPLIVDLEDAGVPVVATTFEDHVQASADFADLVETSMIAHAGSPELDAAVLMSRWRKQGDRRSLDVRVGDVSMLEAVALAAWLGRASYDPLDSVAGTGDWQPEPGEEPGEDYDVTDSIA